MNTGDTQSWPKWCDFCRESRGLPSEALLRYPAFLDGKRIARSGQHLFVVPTLGQLARDHALIISKEHITSSAQLNEQAMAELIEISSQLQANANKDGKSHLIFEHGVPSEAPDHGGCGICHC